MRAACFRFTLYLRSCGREDGRGAFGVVAVLGPTSMPPIRAKDSMAWFIFDTFMAASPRLA